VEAELPPAGTVDPLSEDMERAQRELLARYGREFSPEIRARAGREGHGSRAGHLSVGRGVMVRVKP
jgi:hypothetical protein